MGSGKVPPIFIFCAGLHTVPYARLAAEAIVRTWPPERLGELDITVSLVAMSKCEISRAEEFLRSGYPENIHTDDSFKMGPFFFRPKNSKTRQRVTRLLFWLHRLGQQTGIPPWLALKLMPMPPTDFLGAAHNPWISYVCYKYRNHVEVCIVDADLFMMDHRFCERLSQRGEGNVFSRGWIDRYGNVASYQGKDYVPAGSECVAINTNVFLKYSRQFLYSHPSILEDLKKRYPGITFQPGRVDSFYYESWRSQLEGFRINYPFRDLKLCHVGGFGHASVDYITNALDLNDNDMAVFWIRRLRANQRVLSLFGRLKWDSWVLESGKIELMESQIEQILSDPETRTMWESALPSEDELLIQEITGDFIRT